jgi:hypothetical protein
VCSRQAVVCDNTCSRQPCKLFAYNHSVIAMYPPRSSERTSGVLSQNTMSSPNSAIRDTKIYETCPPSCIICFEPLTTFSPPTPGAETAVTIKKCGHVFGKQCLARWMREHNTCPVCRVEFFKSSNTTTAGRTNNDGPEHFALGVYAMDRNTFQVMIHGGRQTEVRVDVNVDMGDSARDNREGRAMATRRSFRGMRCYYA